MTGFSPEQAREVNRLPASVSWLKAADAIDGLAGACRAGMLPEGALADLSGKSPAERQAFVDGLECAAYVVRSGVEELLAALAREPGS